MTPEQISALANEVFKQKNPVGVPQPPKSPFWILAPDGKTPLPTDNVQLWGECRLQEGVLRRTGFGDWGYEWPRQSVQVSTVFLGMDHGWGISAEPVLWETMVFGGELDGEMSRYSSFDDALEGHHEMVERVAEAWNRRGK